MVREVGGRGGVYIFGFGAALQVWFDRFVLFVELGQVWDEVFDDVGVGERVDAGFVGCVRWDAACVHITCQRPNLWIYQVEAYISKPGC